MATTLIHGFRLDNLRGDIFGGVTAAVVALPLALAFGVASGAGPIAGLYGAIAVGLFAALFGGTPAQVSGPTGPMTVVMATIVLEYAHDPAMAFTIVMLGGGFQILFGIFRVGHYVNMMPYPVISGFMTGIGCIIIILQVGPLLGHANPAGGPLAAMLEIPRFVANLRPDALAVGVATLALVLFVPRVVARLVPPALIALGVGTALALTVFEAAPVLGQMPTGLPDLIRPSFTLEALPGMVTSALVLATLGSLDSLLTSLIADNATRTHHKSNRELIGQGIGNMVAGLIGGLPGAGATMRTVVNVRAGGRTPISVALHALVLLALVLGLAPLAANIPLAALAGILVKVGIDIIDWSYLKRIRRAPREGVIFMLVVLALTVFVNLILAVAAGVVMASLLLVKRMTDIQVDSMLEVTPDNSGEANLTAEELKVLEQTGGRLMLFVLGGPINFGAAKAMHQRLSSTDRFDALVLDLSDVPLMDSSASIALEDIIVQVQDRGKSVFIVGMRTEVRHTFRRIGILDILPRRHRAIASRLDGLRRAAEAIDSDAEQSG